MSNITKDQVIEWLSAQSVLDVANLVKDLETKWGVSAAAHVASPPLVAPPLPLLPNRRRRLTSSSRARALPRSMSLRKSAPSLAWASRKPRTSSTPPPSQSRKACPRTKPRISRPSSRPPAPRSRSSNPSSDASLQSGEGSTLPGPAIPPRFFFPTAAQSDPTRQTSQHHRIQPSLRAHLHQPCLKSAKTSVNYAKSSLRPT